MDESVSGAVLPDFITFPRRWKDVIAGRSLDGDFDGFVTFGNRVESRVGHNRGLTRANRDNYSPAHFLVIHAVLGGPANAIRNRQVEIGRASARHTEDEGAGFAIAKLIRVGFGGFNVYNRLSGTHHDLHRRRRRLSAAIIGGLGSESVF